MQAKQLTIMERRALVPKLLMNCTILNKYCDRVLLVMKQVIEHKCQETSWPYTNYMDGVLSAITNCQARVLTVHTNVQLWA